MATKEEARYFRGMDMDALDDDQREVHDNADTIWVYSPTGGGFTGHNLNEMSPDQKEQLAGRLATGEVRMAEGPGQIPGAPEGRLEARVARRPVIQEAGSVMAPRQGVDPQRTGQELSEMASAEVKAEYEAVRALGDPSEVPVDELLQAKQDAGRSARADFQAKSVRQGETTTSPEGGMSDADKSADPASSGSGQGARGASAKGSK